MSNTKTKRTFAEEGLEAVQEESVAAEETLTAVSGDDTGEEEFVQVGGLEPVTFFYRTSAPKAGKTPKQPFKILEKGQTIIGVYERSFIAGKFKNPTFLIRLNTGELVGLPGAGKLTKAMDKLQEGSKVKITYGGMEVIKGGEWEGSDSHVYTVFGSKLKPQG